MNKSFSVAVLGGVLLAAPVGAQTAAPGPASRDARVAQPKAAECGAMPATLDGVAFAIDGDTLALLGQKAHVRIWGIQAPELRDKDRIETVPGMRARASLEDLLEKADRKVKCRPLKWDVDCQLVAQCTTAGSVDVGGQMISGGMAYGHHLDEVLPWEARANQRYATAESLARDRKLGLWPFWLGEK